MAHQKYGPMMIIPMSSSNDCNPGPMSIMSMMNILNDDDPSPGMMMINAYLHRFFKNCNVLHDVLLGILRFSIHCTRCFFSQLSYLIYVSRFILFLLSAFKLDVNTDVNRALVMLEEKKKTSRNL